MSKFTTQFTSQLVHYTTPLPFDDVISRLEKEINKANAHDMYARIINTQLGDEKEISEVTKSVTGTGNFLYVAE